MKKYKIILVILLVAVALFSTFKYILTLKEKYALLANLNLLKMQVIALEKEKQNLLQTIEKEKELQQKLTQENLGLKDSLKTSEEKLAEFNTDLIQAQKTIEELSSQITAIKLENTALKDEKEKLFLKLNQVLQEKEVLKPKKAIEELKKPVYQTKREIKKPSKSKIPPLGNRGFLIKDGKSTYPSTKIRIEVEPAP